MSGPVKLPEHMHDSGEWKDWPRKLEAHLRWGVRQRQIEAFTRSGKLKVYVCPDESSRLDPDQLREMFGDPGVVQGRDRDLSSTDRKRKLADAEIDPAVAMFGKATSMMEEMHQQSIGLLRSIPDGMKTILDFYRDTLKQMSERIALLESRADEVTVLRSELEDAKQEREIAFKRHEASEKRRTETLELLKDQVPTLVKQWVEGNSLADFARRTPRDAVEVIIDSGALAERDADVLRRGAGIPPKPAQTETNQSNGAV